ncbi:MAG: hypothetical protein GY828_00775 [Candidatus Gracilibacteria bacterium]|nr:hypothetical protein [Candidatus Gracilibacteria bacterium]
MILILVVYITRIGNVVEIIVIFIANFIANIGIMVMQGHYTNKNNKIASFYHIGATTIFLFISLYGYFILGQSQYLIWQITYGLAAVKAFSFYNFNKELSFINEYSFIGLNSLLFLFFIFQLEINTLTSIQINLPFITQALGFSLITTGLVSIKDSIRYWLNILGIFLLSSGSMWLSINSYFGRYPYESASIDAIAIGYFILTLTVFVYYAKLLPKYLKK